MSVAVSVGSVPRSVEHQMLPAADASVPGPVPTQLSAVRHQIPARRHLPRRSQHSSIDPSLLVLCFAVMCVMRGSPVFFVCDVQCCEAPTPTGPTAVDVATVSCGSAAYLLLSILMFVCVCFSADFEFHGSVFQRQRVRPSGGARVALDRRVRYQRTGLHRRIQCRRNAGRCNNPTHFPLTPSLPLSFLMRAVCRCTSSRVWEWTPTIRCRIWSPNCKPRAHAGSTCPHPLFTLWQQEVWAQISGFVAVCVQHDVARHRRKPDRAMRLEHD